MKSRTVIKIILFWLKIRFFQGVNLFQVLKSNFGNLEHEKTYVFMFRTCICKNSPSLAIKLRPTFVKNSKITSIIFKVKFLIVIS